MWSHFFGDDGHMAGHMAQPIIAAESRSLEDAVRLDPQNRSAQKELRFGCRVGYVDPEVSPNMGYP